MQPDPHFHQLGLLSMLIIILSLALILRTWGANRANSLSGHAGKQRHSYLLFAVALTVGGVLFWLFAWRWLEPALHLGNGFTAVLALALLFELTAAFVPDNGGRNSRIHRTAAWTMAILLLVLVLLLAMAPALHGAAKVLAIIFAVYMLFEVYLFLFVKRSRPYFLIFQSTYILSFYLTVLAATYLR